MRELSLDVLHEEGVISPLDIHFARLMERCSAKPSRELALGAALVSSHTRAGNICLDLHRLGSAFWSTLGEGYLSPDPVSWSVKLGESGVAGPPGEYAPLILDGQGRLYLFRYWDYQEKLAALVKSRVREPDPPLDPSLLMKGLARLFPSEGPGSTDWQRVAAFTALVRPFTVISGGPGTGKTATVAKILALLLENAGPEKKVRIGLACPTGKGAGRLQEAIRKAKAILECEDPIRRAIPEEASTIHRLLGTISGSPYFRHHRDNPLPLDVLVVDEASMVDLPLMSKLIQALPSASRVILLGDKDQLSSVEAGAVLGDICEAGLSLAFSNTFCHDLREMTGYEIQPVHAEDRGPSMRDCIVSLTRNYRFGGESGIAAVSAAVKEGDADSALAILKDETHNDLTWQDLHAWPASLKPRVMEGFRDLFTVKDPMEVFEHLDDFRILCGLREGPYGVTAVNEMVERMLKEEDLIRPEGRWYRGRPVLISRNDYPSRLYNGDMGIALPDPAAGNELRVFFRDGDGGLRKFHPLRLPEHETMYAVTVHKSQGSEFDHVLLVLPDQDSPVLTRELVYTAITRARERVEIWGDQQVFRNGVARRTTRASGLRDALLTPHQGAPSPSRRGLSW